MNHNLRGTYVLAAGFMLLTLSAFTSVEISLAVSGLGAIAVFVSLFFFARGAKDIGSRQVIRVRFAFGTFLLAWVASKIAIGLLRSPEAATGSVIPAFLVLEFLQGTFMIVTAFLVLVGITRWAPRVLLITALALGTLLTVAGLASVDTLSPGAFPDGLSNFLGILSSLQNGPVMIGALLAPTKGSLLQTRKSTAPANHMEVKPAVMDPTSPKPTMLEPNKLQQLDDRLLSGHISETTYLELRSKYQAPQPIDVSRNKEL